MYLRQYLKKAIRIKLVSIQEGLKNLESALNETRKSSQLVTKIDINNAVYEVHLFSLWRDHGGKDVKMEYRGSISEAIEAAEKEFRTVNNCPGVSAERIVGIKIGNQYYSVPEKYWIKKGKT